MFFIFRLLIRMLINVLIKTVCFSELTCHLTRDEQLHISCGSEWLCAIKRPNNGFAKPRPDFFFIKSKALLYENWDINFLES